MQNSRLQSGKMRVQVLLLLPKLHKTKSEKPKQYVPLTQEVEYLTFNQKVCGSSPQWHTIRKAMMYHPSIKRIWVFNKDTPISFWFPFRVNGYEVTSF